MNMKNSNRIVECHDASTSVFTEVGELPWSVVASRILDGGESIKFLSIVDGRQLYVTPTLVTRENFTGELLIADNGKVCFAVTPEHRMYVIPEHDSDSKFTFREAKNIYGKPCWMAGIHPTPKLTDFFFDSHHWTRETYHGHVYCATVPGGVLLTSRDVDGEYRIPSWSGNSQIKP